MFWNKNHSCHWVRGRLPLLAGGELTGPERRRAERHLIGCASCRVRLGSLREALGVLRAVAESSPTAADSASSLWPGLAREIRESRRPLAAPPWTAAFSRVWAWSGVGVAAGLLATLFLLNLKPNPEAGPRPRPPAVTAHVPPPRPVPEAAPVAPTDAPAAASSSLATHETTTPAEVPTPAPAPATVTASSTSRRNDEDPERSPLPPTDPRESRNKAEPTR